MRKLLVAPHAKHSALSLKLVESRTALCCQIRIALPIQLRLQLLERKVVTLAVTLAGLSRIGELAESDLNIVQQDVLNDVKEGTRCFVQQFNAFRAVGKDVSVG